MQHPSLLGSAGTDAYVKLWDLRAKNVAMTMTVGGLGALGNWTLALDAGER